MRQEIGQARKDALNKHKVARRVYMHQSKYANLRYPVKKSICSTRKNIPRLKNLSPRSQSQNFRYLLSWSIAPLWTTVLFMPSSNYRHAQVIASSPLIYLINDISQFSWLNINPLIYHWPTKPIQLEINPCSLTWMCSRKWFTIHDETLKLTASDGWT